MGILEKKKQLSVISPLEYQKPKVKLNPKQAEEIIKSKPKVNNIENTKAVEINQ